MADWQDTKIRGSLEGHRLWETGRCPSVFSACPRPSCVTDGTGPDSGRAGSAVCCRSGRIRGRGVSLTGPCSRPEFPAQRPGGIVPRGRFVWPMSGPTPSRGESDEDHGNRDARAGREAGGEVLRLVATGYGDAPVGALRRLYGCRDPGAGRSVLLRRTGHGGVHPDTGRPRTAPPGLRSHGHVRDLGSTLQLDARPGAEGPHDLCAERHRHRTVGHQGAGAGRSGVHLARRCVSAQGAGVRHGPVRATRGAKHPGRAGGGGAGLQAGWFLRDETQGGLRRPNRPVVHPGHPGGHRTRTCT